MSAVSWAEYAAAMPDMAAAGHRLLYQFGPGLGYLATVRADGGPRVHPTCPHVVEGDLWIFIAAHSPKRSDLDRDDRYALHTFPCVDVDDEFYVTGRAERVDDTETRERIRRGFVSNTTPEEILYRFTLERALLSTYAPRPAWPPAYTRWKA
ncbi:MAG: pyridoxamine 5'-phosphate oxidase family protein [Acidimicrobiia bacterium]